MKKILIILLSIFIISGCEKKLTWDDVKNTFKEAENEVDSITKDIEVITEDDYQALLVELNDYIDDIEYSQDQDNQDLLKRTYKVAQYIETFASLFDGNCAQELLALSSNTKSLVKNIYDGNKDDFEKTKDDVKSEITEISSWAKDQWSSVEKKIHILWDSVANDFDTITENAKSNLTDFNILAENELDDLKHTITDNYDLIKEGVTEDTNEIAKSMYEAAEKLALYTKRIYSKEADDVYYFARHAQSYIKECYGKVLEENEILEQNFSIDIEAAKKWTQSTWNIITKDLKLLVMPKE